MKKILLSFTLFFLFVFSASANSIDSIDITVSIRQDGSAEITQTWVTDSDEGTEHYIPMQNMNGMEIEEFSVEENGVPFENIPWDIDKSREEKAGKCGVVETSKGYELCWGIGEYGQHTYTIRYVLTNMVRGFNDYDGFNVRFVNDEMNPAPDNVKLMIVSETGQLNEDNTAMWAFGFDGEIWAESGGILAYSNNFNSSSHMTVMLRFEKGLFDPSYLENASFSELQDRAFEGSDYGDDESFFEKYLFPLLMFLAAAAAITAAAVAVFQIMKSIRAVKKMYKEAEYCRDVPFGGDLECLSWFTENFDLSSSGENNVIGAYMLRMTQNGCVSALNEEKEKFFGLSSETEVSLRLHRAPVDGEETELALFRFMREAAGEDGTLQQKELEKYSRKHYNSYNALLEKCMRKGSEKLNNYGVFTPKKGFKYYKAPRSLSEEGVKKLKEIMGLKKYLLEFSLINERSTYEAALWRDYLSFAYLVGIADKVIEELKGMYPEHVTEITNTAGTVYMASCYSRMAMRGYRSGYSAAHRSSGGGGSASFGGGGGFSGGGSGGGTR